MPRLLPWLVVLALLALPSNRHAGAWLVWAPLVAVAALGAGLWAAIEASGREEFSYFIQAACAATFGLAALWLLGAALSRCSRLVNFVATALAIAALSLLAFSCSPVWDELDGAQSWAPQVWLYAALFSLVCGVVFAGALNLAGLMCRRRFSGVRVLLWVPFWLWVMWVAAALITGAVMSLGFGEATPWLLVLGETVVIALISYAALLPFLVLSICSAFFQQRLRELMRLGREDAAPPATSSVPLTQPSQVG